MAKKKVKEIVLNNVNQTLDDIMSDRFGRYSKYIIQERALPDARDGLKPVQRRILYAMDYDGNTFDKSHRKSAKTVGLVIGTFHPHGDTSVYEAMVRMSQDWKYNLPLVDMHGNNGSIDDDPPAAMRYTEARLSKNASLLLEDIDKQTVTMTNNYDDTEVEPTVLPNKFPLLLVNGSTGIASGYATNMAPHNINEVIDATIHRIKHPTCHLDSLMKYIKGPDFPTGGIVQGKEFIRDVFKTGKGKVILRSKCEINDSKTNPQIIVTEIPYEVIKSSLVKKISDISINKDIEGIGDVRDESGRNGLKIVIDVKKDVDPKLVLNYLYKNTDLQINYNYNNIAIVNHRPTLMSLEMCIDTFIVHRKEVVLNRSKYLKAKKEERLHIIEGLIKAISILDAVIETIRKSKDKSDAKNNLIKAFLFTETQAEAIVNLRLYRLSSTDIKQLKEEYTLLTKEVNELKAIIKSKEVLESVLIKELEEINKTIIIPRRTKVEDEVEEIVIDKVAMVPNEECYIAISKDGYLKRFSTRAYSANEGQITYTKENDELIGIKHVETLDTLLIFTTKGNYAYLPVYKIDECKFKDIGKHVSEYVKMEGQEKVVGAILVKNFETFAFVLTVTKHGMIKKTSIPRFDVLRSSKALSCMKLKKDDELVAVSLCYEDDDILLVSKNGYYNYYSSSILQDLAPKALGVGAISVKNDEVAGMCVNHNDGSEVFISSQRGGMKRLHFEELNMTSRNTKGSRLFKQTKSKPHEITIVKDVNSYTNLLIIDKEVQSVAVSQVPFMDCESTFSSPVVVDDTYSIIKDDMSDIIEAQIIDIPDGYYVKDDESEQTNLFEE